MNHLVDWSDELSVGIQEIDEQHKELLNILNELNEGLHGVKRKEVRLNVLNKLVEYTKVHFAVEESLMRILDYPDYEEHKAEHDRLIVEINEFRDLFGQDEVTPTYELLIFLKRWLFNHIMKVDKHYEQHFIKMGVKRSWAKKSWLGRFWH
ncbi:MAG: hemerythrin family protein [Gammaproteobacteria bacterium]|nr:hemerythrin family protein [Gammaproteobacteria bacterium]